MTTIDPNRNRLRAAEVRRDPPDVWDFRRRCHALFGHCDVGALQLAFEKGHTAIEDWCGGRKIPRYAWLVIELLEACPPTKWPKRWRDVKK